VLVTQRGCHTGESRYPSHSHLNLDSGVRRNDSRIITATSGGKFVQL